MTRFVVAIAAGLALIGSPGHADTTCPDGTYVKGNFCQLAPDGRYVSAGDGTKTDTSPRLAPNGKYVGGQGSITLCPDGSYTAGSCHLMPDGTYK
jgi:hypothetical protein